MNPIADYINDILSINSLFSTLNVTISKTIGDVMQLDVHIVKLSDSLSKLSSLMQTRATQVYKSAVNDRSIPTSISSLQKGASIPEIAKSAEETTAKNIKSYIKAAQAGNSGWDAGIGLIEELNKLEGEKIIDPLKGKSYGKAVKGTLGMIDNITDAFDATSGIEKLVACIGVLEGLEGVITAALALNPAGWVIGGAILAAGITTAVLYNSKKQSGPYDNPSPSFAEVAEKNGNPYVETVDQSKNIAKEYAQIVREQNDRVRIPTEVERLKNVFLKERTIKFDYKRAQSDDPVYLKAMIAALEENYNLPNKPIKEVLFSSQADEAAFHARYDPDRQYPTRHMDNVPVQWIEKNGLFKFTRTKYISPKDKEIADGPYTGNFFEEYNKLFDVGPTAEKYIASYRVNGYPYVKRMHEHDNLLWQQQPGVAEKAWKEFNQAMPIINSTSQGKAGTTTQMAGTAGSGTTIYITKPLIEHFTVYVKDIKEGVNSMKRQVEDALIEVLNAAKATK